MMLSSATVAHALEVVWAGRFISFSSQQKHYSLRKGKYLVSKPDPIHRVSGGLLLFFDVLIKEDQAMDRLSGKRTDVSDRREVRFVREVRTTVLGELLTGESPVSPRRRKRVPGS